MRKSKNEISEKIIVSVNEYAKNPGKNYKSIDTAKNKKSKILRFFGNFVLPCLRSLALAPSTFHFS